VSHNWLFWRTPYPVLTQTEFCCLLASSISEKSIEYDFCPHRFIISCSISQGKIISVNWLLCYRFFAISFLEPGKILIKICAFINSNSVFSKTIYRKKPVAQWRRVGLHFRYNFWNRVEILYNWISNYVAT